MNRFLIRAHRAARQPARATDLKPKSVMKNLGVNLRMVVAGARSARKIAQQKRQQTRQQKRQQTRQQTSLIHQT